MYSIVLSENIGKFASREFITLDEDTLVAEGAKVMRNKNTLCILAVSKDSYSAYSVSKREYNIICPYCQSKFKNNSEMSEHIDQIHIGNGLLE